MKLNQLPDDVHLTYCTNIHAGESWRDIRASLDEHVPAIKSSVAPNQPMGIGLRLSGAAAASAREPEALASFRDQLSKLGAYVFTINAFPFGPFHGVRVKEHVYLPDWRDREQRRRAGRDPTRRRRWQYFDRAWGFQTERPVKQSHCRDGRQSDDGGRRSCRCRTP
jgi:hypothetical protein